MLRWRYTSLAVSRGRRASSHTRGKRTEQRASQIVTCHDDCRRRRFRSVEKEESFWTAMQKFWSIFARIFFVFFSLSLVQSATKDMRYRYDDKMRCECRPMLWVRVFEIYLSCSSDFERLQTFKQSDDARRSTTTRRVAYFSSNTTTWIGYGV